MILEVCFAAVLTDCHGNPETVEGYHVRAGTVILCGSGLDPEGNPFPIYCGGAADGGSALTVRATRPQPATPGAVCIAEDVPSPGLGEVAMLRAEVRDLAGNSSDDPCL